MIFKKQQIYNSKIDMVKDGVSVDGFPVTISIFSKSIRFAPVFWGEESDLSLGGNKRSNIRGYDLNIELNYERTLEPTKVTKIFNGLTELADYDVTLLFYPDAEEEEFFEMIPSGGLERLLDIRETIPNDIPVINLENKNILNEATAAGSPSPTNGDADSLQGLVPSDFLRSNTNDTYEQGNVLTMAGRMNVQNTTGNTFRIGGITLMDTDNEQSLGTNAQVEFASVIAGNLNIGNWDDAHSWGDHAQAGYASLTGAAFSGDVTAPNLNTNNWNTAYDERGSEIAGNGLLWNGSQLVINTTVVATTTGGLTQFSGNDFNTYFKSDGSGTVTSLTPQQVVDDLPLNVDDWDNAFGWGDHAQAGYAELSGAAFTGDVTAPNLEISNWDTAYDERGSQIAGVGLEWNALNGTLGVDGVAFTGDDLTVFNASESSRIYGANASAEIVAYTYNQVKQVLQLDNVENLAASELAGDDLTWNALTETYDVTGNFADEAHTHDADDIISGTLATSRIPNLDAGKITTGTFDSSRIPNLAAGKITSGTFDLDRIPTIPNTKLQESTISGRSLGQSLFVLQAGTGITMLDYDGSTARTVEVTNPFNPNGDYSGLRARETTIEDVGGVASTGGSFSGNITAPNLNIDNWDVAYNQRSSQVAGSGLTWTGTELEVDSTFIATSLDGLTKFTGNSANVYFKSDGGGNTTELSGTQVVTDLGLNTDNWDTAYDRSPTGLEFSNGTLTLNQQVGTETVSLDGRYGRLGEDVNFNEGTFDGLVKQQGFRSWKKSLSAGWSSGLQKIAEIKLNSTFSQFQVNGRVNIQNSGQLNESTFKLIVRSNGDSEFNSYSLFVDSLGHERFKIFNDPNSTGEIRVIICFDNSGSQWGNVELDIAQRRGENTVEFIPAFNNTIFDDSGYSELSPNKDIRFYDDVHFSKNLISNGQTVIDSSRNFTGTNAEFSGALDVAGNATVLGSNGLDLRRGLTGGYGTSTTSSSDWGANIWSIGNSWSGSGSGTTFSVGNYGLAWLRNNHASAYGSSEGLYLYRASTTPYAHFGHSRSFINGGNVGIGTTSPSAKLHVSSGDPTVARFTRTGSQVPNIMLANGDGDIVNFGGRPDGQAFISFQRPNGRLGIGTSWPSYTLDVNGTLGVSGNAEFSGALDVAGNASVLGDVSINSRLIITGSTSYSAEGDSNIYIRSSASNNSQAILIGADEVNNVSYIEALRTATGWNTPLSLQSQGGNVGIGTTSPDYKLDVNGTTRSTKGRFEDELIIPVV